MAVHIVTVGVSLLTNATKAGVVSFDPADEEAISRARTSSQMREALVNFVSEDPAASSAELNAMGPYLDEGSVEEVYLIATTTQACELAAEVLREVLRSDFSVAVCGKGPRVQSADEEELFALSLERLWDAIINFATARQREGKAIAINATGGLKPELAVCLIAGNLVGAPVYYRHEHFGRTVTLPTIVWPLCPESILQALKRLPASGLSGRGAEQYVAENDGFRLQSLRLVAIETDSRTGMPYRVRIAPYGRLLLRMEHTVA